MRRVVQIVVVLAVVGATAGGVVGRSEAVFVPETLAHRAPVGSAPVLAPFAIDHLGVLWDVPDGHQHDDPDHRSDGPAAHDVEGAELHGAVRFRDEAGRWGPWIRLLEDGAEMRGQWASGLVTGDGAVAYQVRGLPDHAIAPRAVAINVTDGPPVQVADRAGGAAAAVAGCLSRAEWGADESLRFDAAGNEIWPPEHYPAQVTTVHHTATANDDPDPEGRVRAIYRYHAVDRGWGDIGYHYLIDESGRVYEGRWSGTASSLCSGGGDGSDFAHDEADGLVTAGHTGGYNSGNAGIALLGEFTYHRRFGAEPKPAAVEALEDVLTDLAIRHGMDPLGTVDYLNPVSGDTKDGIDTIAGHRDYSATECPGERLYEKLPQIRDHVAAQMGTGGGGGDDPADTPPTAVIVNPPDGATVAGDVTIQVQASDAEDAAQELAVEISIAGGTWQAAAYDTDIDYHQYQWQTTETADGGYTIDARVTDSVGNTSDASPIVVTVANSVDSTGAMRVSELSGSATGFRSTWHAEVTITVMVDGAAFGGAVVSGSWDPQGTNSAQEPVSTSCATASDGRCTVSSGALAKSVSSTTWTVTDVTSNSGNDWDSANSILSIDVVRS
jgi:hypothetical protein